MAETNWQYLFDQDTNYHYWYNTKTKISEWDVGQDYHLNESVERGEVEIDNSSTKVSLSSKSKASKIKRRKEQNDLLSNVEYTPSTSSSSSSSSLSSSQALLSIDENRPPKMNSSSNNSYASKSLNSNLSNRICHTLFFCRVLLNAVLIETPLLVIECSIKIILYIIMVGILILFGRFCGVDHCSHYILVLMKEVVVAFAVLLTMCVPGAILLIYRKYHSFDDWHISPFITIIGFIDPRRFFTIVYGGASSAVDVSMIDLVSSHDSCCPSIQPLVPFLILEAIYDWTLDSDEEMTGLIDS